jgi:hypothetical protein
VSGVTDNHISLGHPLHHTLLGPLHLDLLDFALDLGVAFHLLVFLFNFLFGHFELTLIVPPLVQVI